MNNQIYTFTDEQIQTLLEGMAVKILIAVKELFNTYAPPAAKESPKPEQTEEEEEPPMLINSKIYFIGTKEIAKVLNVNRRTITEWFCRSTGVREDKKWLEPALVWDGRTLMMHKRTYYELDKQRRGNTKRPF